jgi:SsrA-binding protein
VARDKTPSRIAAQNRKARHEYQIEDTLEAGVMLLGTEVKSLRAGRASIGEAFAGEQGGELYLLNSYIPEYDAARDKHPPRRARKLLLHKREMNRLLGAVSREGMTIIPLSIYFNDRGIAKVQLGLARGKRKADKRQAEKSREWERDRARLLRSKG